MNAERETVALGSCPACGGPAQFIGDGPEPQTYIGGLSYRHVALPNIDEDLGDGWVLREIYNHGLLNPPWRQWEARATNRRPDQIEAFGDSPAAAYLALRSAIEARS